ncbi:PRK06851 family protein [Anaerosporobacter faecicola]|uniref:PRK06851 family protein n=1 Tax=Anaerosporobacter faecicola TaxID=2718714 RepID=UPI00143BE128|nr:PRK06851 family protein [Anaerosporobacter faecicola]
MAEKHYFACGNTAKGFQNMFDSNLAGLKKIFILKGGPGTGKSTLMKRVGEVYVEKGYDVEYIHCSSDPDSLDGVIVRALGVGIVDGTTPHVIEPKVAGGIEEYVNLGTAWNIRMLEEKVEVIKRVLDEIHSCYPKAYDQFAKALSIHDEWEKIYITNMDLEGANILTEQVVKKILGECNSETGGVTRHRFFGGSTPKGAMDYVENITATCKKRYLIKGRPGSGKSTMLKKIWRRAQSLGLDVEVYHCGFDPNSLDMILLPSLQVCIFDSTAPHEYEPNRENDEVIDMYEKLITPGTDEKYEEELKDIKKRYRDTVAKGIAYLKKAKDLHDDLEKYYIAATDYTIIDQITEQILERIASIEPNKQI